MSTPMFQPSDFEGHQGQPFLVRGAPPPEGPGEVVLTLASVTILAASARGGRQPFSIVFHGPMEPLLPQATHPFAHPDFGRFDLFVVPIGPGGDAMAYEAVFN